MAVNKALTPGQAGTPALAQVKAAGELARRKIYAGIPDDDVALALAICQKYGFDPLLKHLVLIEKNIKNEASGKWEKRYNAYVTRDGLLHAAHTSGMLDGLEVTLGKDELGEWAEAAVYRKDMSRPFRYRVYLSEYAREPRGAWKTHPRAMLTKTAEVFALRRAFDVALTPVEEIGFEDAVAGIPVAGINRAAGTQGGASEFAREQETVGNTRPGGTPDAKEESEGTGARPGRAKKHEQTSPDLPPDWPQEPPWGDEPSGSRKVVSDAGSGKSTGGGGGAGTGSNGNGRRRLF